MLEGLAPAVATAIAGLLVWKFEEFVTAMRTGVDPWPCHQQRNAVATDRQDG